MWLATYCWKALDKGYNFVLDHISIGGLHTKLWGPKVTGVPGQNAIWMWASWKGTEYIRGKVVASSKSGPWWVLWIQVCPWLVLAPKALQQCTNQLVVYFSAGFVWVNNYLSFFLIPSRSSSTPLYPWKCCEPGHMPQLLTLPPFFTLGSHLSLARSLGVRHSNWVTTL
jgi:hypothetical protein